MAGSQKPFQCKHTLDVRVWPMHLRQVWAIPNWIYKHDYVSVESVKWLLRLV